MAASAVGGARGRVRALLPVVVLAWGAAVIALSWAAPDGDTPVAFVALSAIVVAAGLRRRARIAMPLTVFAMLGFTATQALRAGAAGAGLELYLPAAALGASGLAATLVAADLLRDELDRGDDELEVRTAVIATMQQRNPVTGAYRSAPGHEMLVDEVDRCARYTRDCSIVLLSIDDWSERHDQRGEAERDALVRGLLSAYREALRTTDRIIEDGDDFLALLIETGAQPAEIVAERLCAAGERVTGAPTRAGVASFPQSAVTADDLLEEARAALAFARTARVPVAGPTLLG